MLPLHYSYTVYNIEADRQYVINIGLKVCFETNQCTLETQLLNNVTVPKPMCGWDTDFITQGKIP